MKQSVGRYLEAPMLGFGLQAVGRGLPFQDAANHAAPR